MLELVEQFLRRVVGGLERAHALQHILVRDHVGRRGGEPAHEVIDEGAWQFLARDWQIDELARGVGDDVGALDAAEAGDVERIFQQRIESRGEVEIEVGDLGELEQRGRRGERRLAHDGADAGVEILAATAAGEMAHDDVVEGEAAPPRAAGWLRRAASERASHV